MAADTPDPRPPHPHAGHTGSMGNCPICNRPVSPPPDRLHRATAGQWVARLQCRVAGHDWSPWLEGLNVRSRYCRRRCGLDGSLEAERIPQRHNRFPRNWKNT